VANLKGKKKGEERFVDLHKKETGKMRNEK